ncbi:MAG: hypothetical protein RR472_03535, partial [Anaerovoracaceae bacterium]
LICLSSNLVLRLPDAYQYNLSATQSVSESGRVIKEDKLVELFADFMQGKTDKFVLMEDVEYQPENVFNGADQEAMLRLRFALNLILVAGIIALLVTAASYFFLIRWRKKALHMEYFKKSVWVFLLLSIANSLVKLVNPIREATWGKIFGTDFPKHDFLIEIFHTGLWNLASCRP